MIVNNDYISRDLTGLNSKLGPDGIADRLIFRRHKLGMTQQKLAEIVGVSISTIQNYERGATHTIGISLRIRVALGGCSSWFYGGIGYDDPGHRGPKWERFRVSKAMKQKREKQERVTLQKIRFEKKMTEKQAQEEFLQQLKADPVLNMFNDIFIHLNRLISPMISEKGQE